MARLEIEKLSFAVGSVEILRRVSLTVEEGKCLALLGPSGCGKTTTLRLVAGFAQPTAGDVRFAGRSVLALPPHKRNVGLVFQDYALFPHMTVADNVAYGLKRRGVPSAERARRVGEALALVQLEGLKDRLPAQLSGGQQQRVALARALVVRPDVLLLDEPLGALDRKLREQMQVELKRIQREAAITTIIVTHDQEEALSLADEVAVMFSGEIAEIGRPAALYAAPRSRPVMEFLGASNVLLTEIVGRDGEEATLRLAGGETVRVACAVPTGNVATIGFRPEHVVLSTARPAAGGLVLGGTVQEVVYKGPHAEVYVNAGKAGQVSVSWRPEGKGGLEAVSPGADVFLAVAPDRIVVLASG